MRMNRRALLTGAAGLAAAGAIPKPAAAATPRVVVIGGGAGGATAAHQIAKDAKGAVDVTLIEPNQTYTTCFFSNWYLSGFRSFQSLRHSYGGLKALGVRVVHQAAAGIDPDAKIIRLSDGSNVPYDRAVAAPGVDFKFGAIEGYEEETAHLLPHAYKAGPQTVLLRRQLHAMKDGGVFIMVAPPNPYRCPPGPYERVSMIAHYLKTQKPKSKILILDPKSQFSKQDLFEEAWADHYDGMIEWLPKEIIGGGVKAVDAGSMTVLTPDEAFKGDVINVIPPHTAGKIARDTGLADDSGWCPVDPETFESKRIPNIHLVGDAIIPGDMPKSGFSANSQAKVCATAVRNLLIGSRKFPARFSNTCWSLLAPGDAVKVGAAYESGGGKISKTSGFISKVGESAEVRAQTAEEAVGWYSAITSDMFG